MARAGSLLGAALYVHAEYTEAEAVLVQAMSVCDERADAPGQRRCLSYLGNLTHASRRHTEAIMYFLRLMALAQNLEHLSKNHSRVGAPEPAENIAARNSSKRIPDGLDQLLYCTFPPASNQRLHFRKHHLDRIEIWTVRGKIK